MYQSPQLAWKFIQQRSKTTGRDVPIEAFKETFLNSIKNVNNVKKQFSDQIIIQTVKKNYSRSK